MMIEGFDLFQGEHCETTAMGNLLQHKGIRLSEPMLFGIGQGLGFIYWDSKGMDFPFIGGRSKPDVICGMDDEYAYMADTSQQGGLVITRLSNLSLARNAKGPMSSKNRSFTIEPTNPLPPHEPAIRSSLLKNANDYLNPPIQNLGNKGIKRMSSEILKWPIRSKDIEKDLCLTALMMERAGTGGALFRNLYRDFLKECVDMFGDSKLEQAYVLFTEIAPLWSSVSELIDNTGRTGNHQELKLASELLVDISERERLAMELILTI